MKKSSVGVLVILGVLMLGTALAAWLVWPLALNPATGAAVGSVSTALGAVVGFFAAAASAVAAVAAMRAAQQSDDTAQRAIDALAYATAPKLHLRPFSEEPLPAVSSNTGERFFYLWNSSRWPASNLEIELRCQDGHVEHRHINTLEPTVLNKQGYPVSPAEVDFPMRRPMEVHNRAWRGETHWTDTVVVTYSDERGLARWRVEFPLQYTAHVDESTSGYGTGGGDTWGKEVRVSG